MGFSDKKQTVVLNADIDRTFKAMVQVATSLDGYKIENSDPNAHAMRMSQGMSALSWGSDVVVTMAPQGEAQTAVTVEVKSKMPTELFVGGKHQKTLDALVAALRQALA